MFIFLHLFSVVTCVWQCYCYGWRFLAAAAAAAAADDDDDVYVSDSVP